MISLTAAQRLVAGTRQRQLAGTSLKPRQLPEDARPASRPALFAPPSVAGVHVEDPA